MMFPKSGEKMCAPKRFNARKTNDMAIITKSMGITIRLAITAIGENMLKYLAAMGKTPKEAAMETDILLLI